MQTKNPGTTNRQILLESPGKFVVRKTSLPRPGPGEALVRIRKVGVCGSDVHLWRLGRIGRIRMEGPLVIGHEAVGEVVEAGEGVSRDLAGSRVAIEPNVYCGKCAWCGGGRRNLCPEYRFLGLPPRDGAMQEYLVHPAHLLAKLPDGVSDEAGVVLEPMAVALHAVRLAKVAPGQKIVILGTGVLGTCVLALLGLDEGLRVVCVDLLEERLERARKMGAAATIAAVEGKGAEAARKTTAATGGLGAQVVFECAGAGETLWNMCEVAAPGAHLAVIGSNPEDTVSFSSSAARRKGLTLRFVRRSLDTLEGCIEFAARGLVAPEQLVTHVFSAGEAAKAFETVGKSADGVLKALIDMEEW